jgi:hypothetical protein
MHVGVCLRWQQGSNCQANSRQRYTALWFSFHIGWGPTLFALLTRLLLTYARTKNEQTKRAETTMYCE